MCFLNDANGIKVVRVLKYWSCRLGFVSALIGIFKNNFHKKRKVKKVKKTKKRV